MRQPPRRAAVNPRMARVALAARERLSPSMVRVTLAGEELGALVGLGDDQFFRLFFRRDEAQRLTLPSSPRLWWPQYLAIPESRRPHVRAYTVRSWRPAARELDVDIVVHEGDGAGPGMRWALEAPIGEPAGILDSGCLYNPGPRTGELLLAGDATALPGIAAICDGLRDDARGRILLAVDDDPALAGLRAPEGLRVELVDRVAGLPDAVAAAWTPSVGYAYCCAEQSAAAGMRRALAKGRGMSPADITFAGFWREGVAAA